MSDLFGRLMIDIEGFNQTNEEKSILLYETTNYIWDNSFNTFVKDVNFNCSRDEALRISKKNSETIDF